MLDSDRHRRHRLLARDYVVAIVIFCGYVATLVSTMDMGFTRDEGYYFYAAERYHGWFGELETNRANGIPEDSFEQDNIDRHWGANPEHPVLMKTLFGLSWHELSQERDLMSSSTAMRFPTAVFGALLLALIYLFTVEAFGSRGGGIFAAVAMGFMPRFFFHAHLACFDVAITTVWFLVVYAYWRAYHSRLWGWLTGIFFGIALITKLNAFFIPVTLLLHWAAAGWREFRVVKEDGRRRIRIPPIPLAFVSMALLGPLIFYLGWPRHWFDTFNRIAWYIGRHWHHEHYYVYYFGEALVRPPFPVSFPFVMTLITVPVVTLLTASFGGAALTKQWWVDRGGLKGNGPKRDPRATGLLILISLLFPILLIAQPSTPIFGGTKHWMNAMPPLAVLAGVGAVQAFRAIWPAELVRKRIKLGLVYAGFITLLSLPLVHATFYVHPYGTSYYNELVGGVRGAADRELMRQFWGYSTRAGLDLVNQVAPNRARVFPHNANPDAMHRYRVDGLLRDDVRDEWGPQRADYAFFNHQKAFVPVIRDIWRAVGTQAPIRVWTIHGVPVFSLYGDADAQLSDRFGQVGDPDILQ